MNKICALVLLFLCVGCVEHEEKAVVIPQSEDHVCEETDRIYRSIAALDITVVSPAAGITAGRLRDMKLLQKRYGIKLSAAALASKNVVYCSDSVQNRLKSFKDAIQSPNKIIWAMGGGCGTNMLLSEMNKWPTPKERKTVIGFSDVTSLLLFASQKWNWRAIHAPVFSHITNRKLLKTKFATLLGILNGSVKKYDIQNVRPINNEARERKTLAGQLIGGNLTILELGFETCWEIQPRGKILFIEDVNVTPWRIYRSLYHLLESGKLDGVKAIVFGEFTKSGA